MVVGGLVVWGDVGVGSLTHSLTHTFSHTTSHTTSHTPHFTHHLTHHLTHSHTPPTNPPSQCMLPAVTRTPRWPYSTNFEDAFTSRISCGMKTLQHKHASIWFATMYVVEHVQGSTSHGGAPGCVCVAHVCIVHVCEVVFPQLPTITSTTTAFKAYTPHTPLIHPSPLTHTPLIHPSYTPHPSPTHPSPTHPSPTHPSPTRPSPTQICNNPFGPRSYQAPGIQLWSGSARPLCESFNRFWPLYISAANALRLWTQPPNYQIDNNEVRV